MIIKYHYPNYVHDSNKLLFLLHINTLTLKVTSENNHEGTLINYLSHGNYFNSKTNFSRIWIKIIMIMTQVKASLIIQKRGNKRTKINYAPSEITRGALFYSIKIFPLYPFSIKMSSRTDKSIFTLYGLANSKF